KMSAQPVTFMEYANSLPEVKFSHEYFAHLTFGQVENSQVLGEGEQYPKILPTGALSSYIFTSEPLPAGTGESTIIQPGEEIPSFVDTYPIARLLAEAYGHGKRSVQAIINGETKVYHFSKVSDNTHY